MVEDMKHAVIAIVSVILVVAMAVGGAFLVKPEPVQAAQSETLVDCQLAVGQQTRVICTAAGVQVLNTVVDLPTVTLPPVTVTAPGATVTLPPATVTAPAPPRATQTVRVEVPIPGPTKTVTVNVPTDGSTATVTLPPKPGKTVTETVKPNGQPVPTVTETVTEETQVTGQAEPESGRLDPNSEDEPFFRYDFDLGDESVSAGEAGVGILGALLILALIVAGMFYGFRRGLRAHEREETFFLRSMLDRSKTS